MTLTQNELHAFGEAARVPRFGNAEGHAATPITAEKLLAPRRVDDGGDDLWRTFNQLRRVTSREVTGIDGEGRLNRALCTLTERMAALKGGA